MPTAWIVHPPRACALAWLLAWPLTTLTLLIWPQIGYAVGLSGMLHAGALVLAVHLLFKHIRVPKARRWGGLLLLAVLAKLALEQGWSQPVAWDPGNDMSVVLAAHLAGGLWGLVLGLATIPVSLGHMDGHEMVKFMSWAQGIFTLDPAASSQVAGMHPVFKAHLVLGLTILLVFPFTRLVHMLSVPLRYLTRPGYQIVRSRRRRPLEARRRSFDKRQGPSAPTTPAE